MNLHSVLLRGMLAGFLLSAVAVVPAARAQTAEQKERAKDHYQKARRLYDVGRYAEAIDEYQRAYLNVEDPVFLFNIAQAYRLNDQPDEAIRFYKNYLRRAPNAGNRADVEAKIAEMQKLIDDKAKQGTTTTPPPPDTTAPPPPDVTTPPPPDVTTPPPVDTTAPPPSTGPSNGMAGGLNASSTDNGATSRRTAGIVLVGAGGGLIAVAAIAGAIANSKASDLEKSTVFDPDLESSGQTANAVAVVSGLVGVAAASVGLYLLITDSGERQPMNGASTARRGSGRTLALYPTLAPGYAGAGARLSF